MHDDAPWAARFPRLFAEQDIDYAQVTARLTTAPCPEPLVNRYHLVALTEDDRVVVCRSTEQWRFLPGGTREPDESLVELARRELLEEAGAVLLDEPEVFAWHDVTSRAATPYRPHLAHPRAAWAYGRCRVRLDGAPENPDDGEQVVEVLALPPTEAVDWLAVHDPDHAELVALATRMTQG
ncbi:MAG TPA: NUDIX domain-containing protein [Candidatus Avipropionibacterium avicola]|uniref:NUDIX domain-containing protein n=1 Tax=Candidatus Avipropionibacterium avicola TaxID=2840701 RepID=A0A9D1KQ22_9ACTN|nr:NUDIX domain-containing protein [Candidatus Avipropionibacterium avicola]